MACPLGARPSTGSESRAKNERFLGFFWLDLRVLRVPSTSSNHGSGPSGEKRNPRIMSMPDVS